MSSLAFISISVIEYIGVIVVILALFRYTVSHYWPQIVFTSIVCSLFSYVLMIHYDIPLAPMIQMLCLALCFWLLFDTPLIWSFILCSFSIVYAVFQGVVIMLTIATGAASSASLDDKTSFEIYSVQVFCALVCYVLGSYFQRNRIGFLFIPTSRNSPFHWSRMSQRLIVVSLASFLSMISMSVAYAWYSLSNLEWFIFLLVVLLIVSTILLTTIQRKDQEYADQNWNR
ncbi:MULTISPECIES: hypothetical protein [Cohnella]|uniref:hypothetical protein n=1 Tax=Cohnella TaxID=329857 RepID=UPI0009BC7100|nr:MULTISPECIES: hypothetical protein [Cohnella]MBN2983997.1 hypothetical protein [Cohnella algarum]